MTIMWFTLTLVPVTHGRQSCFQKDDAASSSMCVNTLLLPQHGAVSGWISLEFKLSLFKSVFLLSIQVCWRISDVHWRMLTYADVWGIYVQEVEETDTGVRSRNQGLHQTVDILEKYGIGSETDLSELEQHDVSELESLCMQGLLHAKKLKRWCEAVDADTNEMLPSSATTPTAPPPVRSVACDAGCRTVITTCRE